jgi:3D (Asp-Asp-Asp) domain-containing protein
LRSGVVPNGRGPGLSGKKFFLREKRQSFSRKFFQKGAVVFLKGSFLKAKKPKTVVALFVLVLLVYTVVALGVLSNAKRAGNTPKVPEQHQVTECDTVTALTGDLPSRSGAARRPAVIKAVVTAYTRNDPGMDGKGITFTGTKVRPGVAAVDPEVIPLGSVLFVPGYGYARAEDTGGAIKGNRIDLYFEDREEAFRWGKKELDVEILR